MQKDTAYSFASIQNDTAYSWLSYEDLRLSASKRMHYCIFDRCLKSKSLCEIL